MNERTAWKAFAVLAAPAFLAGALAGVLNRELPRAVQSPAPPPSTVTVVEQAPPSTIHSTVVVTSTVPERKVEPEAFEPFVIVERYTSVELTVPPTSPSVVTLETSVPTTASSVSSSVETSSSNPVDTETATD